MNFSLWSDFAPVPLLGLLTLLPLLGAFAVLRAPNLQWGKTIAYVFAAIAVVLGVLVLHYFNPEQPGIQLGEQLQFAGLGYTAGVDRNSILFIPLVPVLALLCLIYLRLTPYADNLRFIASVLAYAGIMSGAFAALNLLQFWFWCALELVPLLWLTSRAGTGANRRQVAGMLFCYLGAGLLLLLAAFVLIAFGETNAGREFTFDWLSLQANAGGLRHEVLIFLLLFFGFAIRMPLFPFHAWLPVLAERGPVASVPVFMMGLKLGIYGMVRFLLPLVPAAAVEWHGFMLTLAILSIFYGALLALMQLNMRRLLAFAVISHTGLLVSGLVDPEPGPEGSLLLAAAFSLATAGMAFTLGLIYQRTGTALLPRLGGMFESNAAIGLLFLVSALCTMTMPATLGYEGMHLLLEGVVEGEGWLLALAILTGNLLAAAFLLRAFQQIFIAHPKRARQPLRSPQQPRREEVLIALAICTLLIATAFTGLPELMH